MSTRLGKGEYNLLFEKKLGRMTLKNDQPIFDNSNGLSQIYLSVAMIRKSRMKSNLLSVQLTFCMEP